MILRETITNQYYTGEEGRGGEMCLLMVINRFRSGRGSGYSAHFIGSTLVLETVGKNIKKPQTHPLEHVFHSFQVIQEFIIIIINLLLLLLISFSGIW